MSKERTQNPHWSGTPQHKAWADGYTAALADAAGIEPKGRQSSHSLGRDFGVRFPNGR